MGGGMSTDMIRRKIDVGKDILEIWRPVEDVSVPMFIEGIHDDYEGFRILMRGENPASKMLRICFEAHLSYRITDESFLLKIWHSTAKEILGKIFYTVEQSTYVDFFNEQTDYRYVDWPVKHYAIYTTTDCIDVLSTDPPVVGWLG